MGSEMCIRDSVICVYVYINYEVPGVVCVCVRACACVSLCVFVCVSGLMVAKKGGES